MCEAIDGTRRLEIQERYNLEHGVEPRTTVTDIASPLVALGSVDFYGPGAAPPRVGEGEITDEASLAKAISDFEKRMREAARRLDFDEAAQLRDRVEDLCAQQIYKT